MCFSLIINTIVCYRVQKFPFALASLLQLENCSFFHFNIAAFLRFNLLLCNCPTFKNRMAFNPRTYHRGVLASRRYLFNHYFALLQQQQNYRKKKIKPWRMLGLPRNGFLKKKKKKILTLTNKSVLFFCEDNSFP